MTSSAALPRLPGLDIARGVALIGMVVFHLTFDLELFGFLPRGTISQPGWMGFARLVAGSFVFLAGVSFILAHGTGIRWRRFRRGTGQVALAALAVSMATWIVMPQMVVFFGILHIITVSRVLGLAFLRLPALGLGVIGVLVWIAPYWFSADFFNTRWLAWVGFSSAVPMSMDLEPIFPWFGPFLLGMAAAKSGLPSRAGRQIGHQGAPWRALAWAGRRSLWIYLIHQPVLIGLVWLLALGLRP